jgi:hypothetical protein
MESFVDIVWMTSDHWKSRVIRFFSRAPFSHVAIVGKYGNLDYLVHAVGKGVCYQPLQSYLDQGDRILFRKTIKLNCSNERLIGFALGEMGKEYSDTQLVMISLNLRWLPWLGNGGSKRICSEFVAAVLDLFSTEYEMPKPLDFVTPKDLFDILKPSKVA